MPFWYVPSNKVLCLRTVVTTTRLRCRLAAALGYKPRGFSLQSTQVGHQAVHVHSGEQSVIIVDSMSPPEFRQSVGQPPCRHHETDTHTYNTKPKVTISIELCEGQHKLTVQVLSGNCLCSSNSVRQTYRKRSFELIVSKISFLIINI